jgi:peptidoglycan/xylan/chitin deacetylase (PgdA/CDA1 family)
MESNTKIKIQQGAILVATLLVLQPILAYADQGIGSVEVNIRYTNGDRADFYGVVLKIYQDFNKTPYRVIDSLTSNPYNIPSLPLGHKYAIEVYVNGMYGSVEYVNLQNEHESIVSTISLPGGIRFTVFYNDGATPIEEALVSIKSKDGKEWAKSITEERGKTLRFWIQSTNRDEDYYISTVSLGSLNYSKYPITVQPGISQEIKIITPWPSIISSLITTNVYSTAGTKVTQKDGSFVVEMYDSNQNKITESKVDSHGQAFFSKFKVGEYVFRAIKTGKNNTEFGNTKIILDGNQQKVDIFRNTETIPEQPTQPEITLPPETKPKPPIQDNLTSQIIPPSCKCVAFRFDNLQDYWLNNVQINVIDSFQKKNAPLTVGIISKAFGDDQKLVSFVKDKVVKNNPKIEIANNGWEFEDFTIHSKAEQSELIKKANEKISSVLGMKPTLFVPPYSKVNSDTFAAVRENNMKYVSAYVTTDPAPYSLSGAILYRFPATVSTGYSSSGNGTLQKITNDQTVLAIQKSIDSYGFAVTRINFQDFAFNNMSKLENQVDLQQISDLESLIDDIQNKGWKIVTIGDIKLDKTLATLSIPEWIKNNAGWWADGKISDSEFIIGIQYMIKSKIIIIQNLPNPGLSSEASVPAWIKNNAGWWADGKISDSDFAKGIEFLVKEGIIKV